MQQWSKIIHDGEKVGVTLQYYFCTKYWNIQCMTAKLWNNLSNERRKQEKYYQIYFKESCSLKFETKLTDLLFVLKMS